MWRIGHYYNSSFEAIGRFGQRAQVEMIPYRYVLGSSVYDVSSANALIKMALGPEPSWPLPTERPKRRHKRARWNSTRKPSVLSSDFTNQYTASLLRPACMLFCRDSRGITVSVRVGQGLETGTAEVVQTGEIDLKERFAK